MKRFFIFLFAAILAVGTVTAQTRIERQRDISSVTIEGTLKLERGLIALESGDSVYFVPMLMRYASFIDGLKEGAKVSVEGYLYRNTIHPTKIIVDNKSYDMIARDPDLRLGENFGHHSRRGNFAPNRRVPNHRARHCCS